MYMVNAALANKSLPSMLMSACTENVAVDTACHQNTAFHIVYLRYTYLAEVAQISFCFCGPAANSQRGMSYMSH